MAGAEARTGQDDVSLPGALGREVVNPPPMLRAHKQMVRARIAVRLREVPKAEVERQSAPSLRPSSRSLTAQAGL